MSEEFSDHFNLNPLKNNIFKDRKGFLPKSLIWIEVVLCLSLPGTFLVYAF